MLNSGEIEKKGSAGEADTYKMVAKASLPGDWSLEDQLRMVKALSADLVKSMPRPITYDAPLHIDEFVEQHHGTSAGKFMVGGGASSLQYSDGSLSAHGIAMYLGFKDENRLAEACKDKAGLQKRDPSTEQQDHSDDLRLIEAEHKIARETMEDLVRKGAVWLIGEDTAESYAKEVWDNCDYVLNREAREEIVRGNDGGQAEKDTAHKHADGRGWRLADFLQNPDAQLAKLDIAEVAGLRIYTSSTFRLINGPLRARITPHPLAFTVLLISRALKKLRAVHMGRLKFQTQCAQRDWNTQSSCHRADQEIHSSHLAAGTSGAA